MLFHSTTFGVFFVAVFCVFWLIHRRRLPRVLFLLAASYLFYMGWSAKYALLIVFQTVSDYYLALLLHRLQNQRLRTVLIWTSVAVNLGVLAVFKYYNFFADSVGQSFTAVGLHVSPPTLNLLLPVGISFYTFHTLSYTLDVYRRQIEPARNLSEFALAVVFFPQLVAGPITRASQFLPQLERTPKLTMDRLRSGLLLIFRGLFKKVLIADVLAEALVDRAYAAPMLASGWHLLLATYGYAFQIYGDFSGYSDIALGAARCLGYELPINFDSPYQATSIRDFWRRWHISLSTFLRDYLYVPLGGSRGSTLRTCRNLMITLILAGLWHGAAWTFVLFGVYHGCLLCGEMLWRKWRGVTDEAEPKSWLARVARIAITFHVLCLGLIIFRAQSFTDIGIIFQRLITWADAPVGGLFIQERGLWMLALAVLLHYVPSSWAASASAWLERRHPVLQGGMAVAALGVVSVFFSAQHPFVYFQF